ncbi:restriction endonuclease subunit S [Planktothricoides raciborskii]|uniref:Restriction endonuclease subunit S n=1 Tax=Planktothricoides raciborskii FACHB-1370 TaxID=2949576 RepID=A0ABR8EH25_9CYAN|nr:restriction endonuclease subunit S [Planktothricoides raciborskii]MBD2544906.1 restriction endonuclease subunit S [Planktothricoides raciborskii FACHB-1370]MBD2583000.1 restriction endonuclease subunit S [Planktothricoides raciborskii FACHB-1261]
MSEWRQYYLTELGTLNRGKSKHRPRWAEHLYGGPYPFIQTGDIAAANKYINSYQQTYSEDGLAQSKLWDKNTLCITIAANIAEVAILNFPACFPDSILGFIPDDKKADLDFIFYTLTFFKDRIKKLAIGSVQDNINIGTFNNIKFSCPPLQEQKRIAAVLSCLDDKIENLRKQNETLEKIAQTLFKHWFIDFEFPNENGQPYRSSGGAMQPSELGAIPAGWRVGKLGDEFNILMGQSPVGSSYNQNGEGLIFFQGRTDFGFRFPTIRLFTTEPKRIANKFDVLVSVRAPVGDINVAFEKCCIGRGLSAVSSNHQSYCLYKLKSFKKFFDVFESEGTVFGSVNKTSFNELKSIIPNTEIIQAFEDIVSPIDRKIFLNENQIQTLTKTRDTLLPELMSGKLRIPE